MKIRRFVLLAGAILAVAAAAPGFAAARHGGDDPAGHVRQARGAGDRVVHTAKARATVTDDRAGDDRGRGRGRDDGAGHH